MENIEFGRLIREKREKLGITADRLAKKIGVDRTYISKIENLDLTPSMQVAYQLCEALGISQPGKILLGLYKLNRKNPEMSKVMEILLERSLPHEIKKQVQKSKVRKDIFNEIKNRARSAKGEKFWEGKIIKLLKKYKSTEAENKELIKKIVELIKGLDKVDDDYINTMVNKASEIYKLFD